MSTISDVCTVIDDRTLRWARPIDAPSERIWAAITNAEESEQWFMKCSMDLRLGGAVVFNLPDPFGGSITQLKPERVLEVTYDSGAGDGFIRFEIGPDEIAFVERMQSGENSGGDGIEPWSVQPGGTGTHWAGVAAGWHGLLDALSAYVTERPLPGMDAHSVLTAEYVEWLRARFATKAAG